MDGNLSKALWIGVSILLFIAVVTIGVSIFSQMKEVSDAATNRIGSFTESMAEEEFRVFDGKEVTGDKVLSAISTYSSDSGEIIVMVATLGKNSGNEISLDFSKDTTISVSSFTQYVSETSQTSLSVKEGCAILEGTDDLLKSKSKALQDKARRDAENPNLPSTYINPTGKFMSQLIYDSNMKIRGILFAQMK